MKKSKWIRIVGVMLCVVLAGSPMADVYAALNVQISRAIAIEAIVSGTNILNVTLKNISDDLAAVKMQFAATNGIATASQYVEIDFNSNAVGAKVVLRTDNRNATIPYTGTGEGAGLVGNTDSKITSPLLWAVFDDSASAKAFVFKGDTDPSNTSHGTPPLPGSTERGNGEAEGLVVDKANPNYETASVLGYATVVAPTGTTGLMGNFPKDADGAGGLRSCTAPIYLVIGGGFEGLTAQKYSTNTLALDLIVQ